MSENPNPRMTWEGCSVLLDINDGDRVVFARLSNGATLKIGNKNYSLKPLIGSPFGSLFQADNGKQLPCLSLLTQVDNDNDVVVEKVHSSQVNEENRDNRSLLDDNKAQTLTGQDIDALRSEGATGNEIVEALIANSATFDKKTQFSQEKYKLKKQKKYAPKVLLRRPFARRFMRVDTLSLLLSMANVTPNSDVLVLDMVGGLVTGAVAERLGGLGHVCNAYFGTTPHPMEIVRTFNLSSEVCIRILSSSVTDLCPAPKEISEVENACNEENQTNEQNEISMSADFSSEDKTMVNDTPLIMKPCKAPKAGGKASEEQLKLWKEHGFSSLIIAAPDVDAWNLVKDLLPLLSYSAPFVIYHQYLQPLATCMHNLQLGRMAINLQITEPWLREYQVLPSRSHPCMQMSAFGGYILSGTKICSS
ncbi:hypothetical protein ACFE04_012801 [Oxalis oulophora]